MDKAKYEPLFSYLRNVVSLDEREWGFGNNTNKFQQNPIVTNIQLRPRFW